MVSAIVLSPTIEASQEPEVGSAQRVVVARARLDVTQPYSIVSNTLVLSIQILSSRGALGRCYSSRVYMRKLHQALLLIHSMFARLGTDYGVRNQ